MDGVKPSVSLPKFDREGKPILYEDLDLPRREDLQQRPPVASVSSGGMNLWRKKTNSDFSFKDAVVNTPAACPVVKVLEEDGKEFKMGEYLKDRTLLGYLRNLEELNLIHSNFLSLGKKGSIHYIGPWLLRIIVAFESSADAKTILANRSIWEKWFFSLEWWKNQNLAFERIAWVKICGIPPFLWNAHLSDAIAARFGEVIRGSTATTEDANLSFEVIGLRVTTGLVIVEKCSISYKGTNYPVWVQEIFCDWLPDSFSVKKTQEDCETEIMEVQGDKVDKSVEDGDESSLVEVSGDRPTAEGPSLLAEVYNDMPFVIGVSSPDGETDTQETRAVAGETISQKNNVTFNLEQEVSSGENEMSLTGETREEVSSGEANVVVTQEIRLNENISFEKAVNKDLFGLYPIINMINAQEKEMVRKQI